MNNTLGQLNRAQPDPLTMRRAMARLTAPSANSGGNATAPSKRAQQQQPQQLPSPPIFRQPPAPAAQALPNMYAAAAAPPASSSSTMSKLDMWRKKRAEMSGGSPAPAPAPAPAPRETLAPPPAPPAPAPAPALPPTPAAPSNMERKLQEYGFEQNRLQNRIDDMSVSVKSVVGQMNEDRKLLLNQVSHQDFKDLHSDLNDAVKEWMAQLEAKLAESLLEINDRSFQMYAEVGPDPCPILNHPQQASTTGQTIEARTKVRVSYPQTKTEEGVFIRYLHVDKLTGEFLMRWVDSKYLHNYHL